MKKVLITIASLFALASVNTHATIITTTVDGGDAIWLAGRTDLAIPALGEAWAGGLNRATGADAENVLESLPPEFSIQGGDIVRVLDPAEGSIGFFGVNGVRFGPEGDGNPGDSNINSFGGISGYKGTRGALVGLFLNNAVPNGIAPGTLDFSSSALGIDFASLAPALGQVFFIGDGVNSSNQFQQFIAPTGATRFVIGLTDAFGFRGNPGAYNDNVGSYNIRIGINSIPVSAPSTIGLLLLSLVAVAFTRKRRNELMK